MSNYQVLARRYRPQKFKAVLGQENVVETLRKALLHHRTAHAYLFSGPRGIGKTSLTRILAKALNCPHLDAEGEPCNSCPSCDAIMKGSSLDVLEIDGASNRGVDDVRKIIESVGYVPSSGSHKIYIIDEVHMLTKEAFNALLKTLEEPPQGVVFLFATTEYEKVPQTILSRCQIFHLQQIAASLIAQKLKEITQELDIESEDEALSLIAKRAEGALRDAESLLDQMISLQGNRLTEEETASALGLAPSDYLFSLDEAGKNGALRYAFELTDRLLKEGKDPLQFLETLMDHFRHLLEIKLERDASEGARYIESAKIYRIDQLLTLLDYLLKMYTQFRTAPSPRIALEAILLHILRSHFRLPVEFLVRRLIELEKTVKIPEGVEPLDPALRGRYDTLMQFAAVELHGQLKKL